MRCTVANAHRTNRDSDFNIDGESLVTDEADAVLLSNDAIASLGKPASLKRAT